MKYATWLLVVYTFLPTAYLFAQVEVPSATQMRFSADYPQVENPHWEYREGGLSAMFTHQHQLIKVFYEKEGEWRETRTRLSPGMVPEAVLNYIQANFHNGLITYAGLVIAPHATYYRIEAEYPSGVSIQFLETNGSLLEKQWIAFTQ